MFIQIALTITSVLLLTCIGGVVFLWRHRQSLMNQINTSNEDLSKAKAHNHELITRNEVLQKTHENDEHRLTDFKKQIDNQLKALASDALKNSNEQFLKLATEKFNALSGKASQDLDARQKAINELVKPIRETLDKQNLSIQKIEESRKEAYGSLKTHLESMTTDQKALRDETAHLVSALRRPEVRGRWGEMQLKRVAEIAGMIENCDFTEQETVTTDDGKSLRPDMVVHLPSDRVIIVDSKAPLDAYIDYIESNDDDARQANLQRHCEQIKKRASELAQKKYTQQFDRTPDFVVMFIPGESFLQAAIQVDASLIETAMNKGVLIATPTTLIALLRAVEIGWREEKVAENAKQIQQLGEELHKRIGTALGYVATLGKHIGKTNEFYNKLVGSLESSVLPGARKFEELGVDSRKKLTEPPTIEIMPRPIRSLPSTEQADSSEST